MIIKKISTRTTTRRTPLVTLKRLISGAQATNDKTDDTKQQLQIQIINNSNRDNDVVVTLIRHTDATDDTAEFLN